MQLAVSSCDGTRTRSPYLVKHKGRTLRMDTVRIEELTSPAVAEAIANGYTTAVVACGAVEQHAPDLPLFMDAEHGSRLAERVAHRH